MNEQSEVQELREVMTALRETALPMLRDGTLWVSCPTCFRLPLSRKRHCQRRRRGEGLRRYDLAKANCEWRGAVCSVLRFGVFRICVNALVNGKAFSAALAKRSPL
jgi:hypothetical protein